MIFSIPRILWVSEKFSFNVPRILCVNDFIDLEDSKDCKNIEDPTDFKDPQDPRSNVYRTLEVPGMLMIVQFSEIPEDHGKEGCKDSTSVSKLFEIFQVNSSTTSSTLPTPTTMDARSPQRWSQQDPVPSRK